MNSRKKGCSKAKHSHEEKGKNSPKSRETSVSSSVSSIDMLESPKSVIKDQGWSRKQPENLAQSLEFISDSPPSSLEESDYEAPKESLGTIDPLLEFVNFPDDECNPSMTDKFETDVLFRNNQNSYDSEDENLDLPVQDNATSSPIGKDNQTFNKPTTPKSNNLKRSISGIIQSVKGQLSLTSLAIPKKKNSRSHFSHSKLRSDYPRQPLSKLAKNKPWVTDVIEVEETPVEFFKFDPKQHLDPDFAHKVPFEYTKPSSKMCNLDGLVQVLPHWSPIDYLNNGDRVELIVSAHEEEGKNVKNNNPIGAIGSEQVLDATRAQVKDFTKMYVYISGKIEMPKNKKILNLSYNQNGTLLIAGEHGLLKALNVIHSKKFIRSDDSNVSDLSYTIERHESLRGHMFNVNHTAWRSDGEMFLSSDEKGVIAGWTLQNGNWGADMVQDSSSSKILGFAWSPSGSKICFMYHDVDDQGLDQCGIVVGCKDGTRLWNRELGPIPPTAIFWVEESKFVLLHKNTIILNHEKGLAMHTRKLDEEFGTGENGDHAEQTNKFGKIIALLGNLAGESNAFTIALVWEWNRMMLIRKADDYSSLVIRTELQANCADWSQNGVYIAIAGHTIGQEDVSRINIYNKNGKILSVVQVPEGPVTNLSWDEESTHLALAVDNLLLYGTVRHLYKYASNGTEFVYSFVKSGKEYLCFWNMEQVNIHEVPGVIVDLSCDKERFAVLFVDHLGVYNVTVLKKTGIPIDSLVVLKIMEPFSICLTQSCVICLSRNYVLFWRYSTLQSIYNEDLIIQKKFRQIHIDDVPSFIPSLSELIDKNQNHKPTKDIAICMDAKLVTLCVGRASGKLQFYRLPDGGIIHTIELENFSPCQLLFNSLSDRIALLDMNGCLRLGHMDHNNELNITTSHVTSEVLNLRWADDMPYHLCVLDRKALHILFEDKWEEELKQVKLVGYLVGFSNLQVKLLDLDNILNDPTKPNVEHVTKIDLNAIDKIRSYINSQSNKNIGKCIKWIEKRNHPRLWEILSKEALKNEKYEIAEQAFIKSKSYLGIELIKKLSEMSNVNLKKAEVCCFLENYEDAEEYYFRSHRRDLAVKMWAYLEEYPKLKMTEEDQCDIEDSTLCSKIVQPINYQEINYDVSNCLKNTKSQATALESQVEAGIEIVTKLITKGNHTQATVPYFFETLGMFSESIKAHLDLGNPHEAVKIALKNYQFKLALEISKSYSVPIVAETLIKYTSELIATGDLMQAVQFLKICDKTFATGKLLAMIALNELKTTEQSLIELIKKIFVMAAIMLSKRPERTLREGRILNTLTTSENIEDEIDLKFDESIPQNYRPSAEQLEWMRKDPWKGAHALQYWILVQKLIYKGHSRKATKVANLLKIFCDILGNERVNCMLALVAANGENFYICSNALSELEKINEERYGEISVSLFANKELKDKVTRNIECTRCNEQLNDYHAICPNCEHQVSICMISGEIMTDESLIWTCKTCACTIMKRKLKKYEFCPVCHDNKC